MTRAGQARSAALTQPVGQDGRLGTVLHAQADAVIDALLAGFSAADIAAAQSQLNEERAS